ncbi:MAG: 5-oxoprolinase subunit PxpB [Acetatifactor sp.]
MKTRDTKKTRYLPAGDSALVVEFGNEVSEKLNTKVQQMSEKIVKASRTAMLSGVGEVIPTFRSLLVTYDPLATDFELLKNRLMKLEEEIQEETKTSRRILKIPCCYGGRYGLDLADLMEYTGLSREEVIERHSSVDYRIYMMGFLPGFAYLGGLDKKLEMPRLKTPRVKIPAGAVGIGGSQTGVYPMDSPGGWRLIGGTPVDFYDPEREEPILCKAGEYIRFVPITMDDYYDIRHMILRNEYCVEAEEV